MAPISTLITPPPLLYLSLFMRFVLSQAVCKSILKVTFFARRNRSDNPMNKSYCCGFPSLAIESILKLTTYVDFTKLQSMNNSNNNVEFQSDLKHRRIRKSYPFRLNGKRFKEYTWLWNIFWGNTSKLVHTNFCLQKPYICIRTLRHWDLGGSEKHRSWPLLNTFLGVCWTKLWLYTVNAYRQVIFKLAIDFNK